MYVTEIGIGEEKFVLIINVNWLFQVKCLPRNSLMKKSALLWQGSCARTITIAFHWIYYKDIFLFARRIIQCVIYEKQFIFVSMSWKFKKKNQKTILQMKKKIPYINRKCWILIKEIIYIALRYTFTECVNFAFNFFPDWINSYYLKILMVIWLLFLHLSISLDLISLWKILIQFFFRVKGLLIVINRLIFEYSINTWALFKESFLFLISFFFNAGGLKSIWKIVFYFFPFRFNGLWNFSWMTFYVMWNRPFNSYVTFSFYLVDLTILRLFDDKLSIYHSVFFIDYFFVNKKSFVISFQFLRKIFWKYSKLLNSNVVK